MDCGFRLPPQLHVVHPLHVFLLEFYHISRGMTDSGATIQLETALLEILSGHFQYTTGGKFDRT